jgi:hypothetical protein
MNKLLVPLALLALSACATTTRRLPMADARAIGAQQVLAAQWFVPAVDRPVPVSVVREGGHVGMKMKTMLVVDGAPVSMLPPKRKATVFLAPGKHVLAIGYAKHPESRPLVQQEFEVAGVGREFSLRLFLGQDPAFEPLSGDAATARPAPVARRSSGETAYFLPACGDTPTVFGDAAPAGIRIVGAHACATPSFAGDDARKASWSDLGNLEEYAEPGSIAQAVDAALAASDRHDWLVGKTGRHLPEGRRYVFTERAGWLDLKHVMATLSNPLTAVPGGSRFASWAVEVAQVVVAPMSAFRREDEVSNHIGADAAFSWTYGPGPRRSRGEMVQEAIDRLEPLTRAQAFARFGVADAGPATGAGTGAGIGASR